MIGQRPDIPKIRTDSLPEPEKNHARALQSALSDSTPTFFGSNLH